MTVFGVAVALNYPWELAQSRLYSVVPPVSERLWHRFVARAGDGLFVLAIFAVCALRRGDLLWIHRPTVGDHLLTLLTGFVIAVAVERFAVYGLERWDYGPAMPLVPVLRVGLAPIAQMLVLPPLVFVLTRGLIEPQERTGARGVP